MYKHEPMKSNRVTYTNMGLDESSPENMASMLFKVLVTTLRPDGSQHHQTLLLPSTSAVHLCASMATDETIESLFRLEGRESNVWFHPHGQSSLPGVAQLIARAAMFSSRWLGTLNMKYVGLRVDMRSGHFIILDSESKRVNMAEFADMVGASFKDHPTSPLER